MWHRHSCLCSRAWLAFLTLSIAAFQSRQRNRSRFDCFGKLTLVEGEAWLRQRGDDLDKDCEILDVNCEILDINSEILAVDCEILDVNYEILDVNCEILDVNIQILDEDLQILDNSRDEFDDADDKIGGYVVRSLP